MIHYVNTDLILEADVDLRGLTALLEERGFWALHVTPDTDGSWSATLETLETEGGFKEPEPNIIAMLNVLEVLEGPWQNLLALCSVRRFDIGYECGEKPWGFSQNLSNATLRRVAAIGGSLAVTIYPPERDLRTASSSQNSQKALPSKKTQKRRRKT